jgi:hypothetical protein
MQTSLSFQELLFAPNQGYLTWNSGCYSLHSFGSALSYLVFDWVARVCCFWSLPFACWARISCCDSKSEWLLPISFFDSVVSQISCRDSSIADLVGALLMELRGDSGAHCRWCEHWWCATQLSPVLLWSRSQGVCKYLETSAWSRVPIRMVKVDIVEHGKTL